MRKVRNRFASVAAGVLLLGVPSVVPFGASALFAQTEAVHNDSMVEAAVKKALGNSRFKDVKVSVSQGIVDLTGSVKVFDDKEQAERKTRRVKKVIAIRNQIQVDPGEMTDAQLRDKLIRQIEYDRVGYGTTAFNAISVSVQNGVVTLGGSAHGPVSADSAFAVAANTPGVQDVINDISVDPLSPMDDQIRIAVFRSVYGFAMLNKYAIDPAKPIRIVVQNGNVTLVGVVDSQADKDAAGIRANQVPNVFHVTNDLQVATSADRPQ